MLQPQRARAPIRFHRIAMRPSDTAGGCGGGMKAGRAGGSGRGGARDWPRGRPAPRGDAIDQRLAPRGRGGEASRERGIRGWWVEHAHALSPSLRGEGQGEGRKPTATAALGPSHRRNQAALRRRPRHFRRRRCSSLGMPDSRGATPSSRASERKLSPRRRRGRQIIAWTALKPPGDPSRSHPRPASQYEPEPFVCGGMRGSERARRERG